MVPEDAVTTISFHPAGVLTSPSLTRIRKTNSEACLRLLRSGGLIVVDNALWGGQVMDSSFTDADTVAIRNLNEKIRDYERVDASLLSVGDGV